MSNPRKYGAGRDRRRVRGEWRVPARCFEPLPDVTITVMTVEELEELRRAGLHRGRDARGSIGGSRAVESSGSTTAGPGEAARRASAGGPQDPQWVPEDPRPEASGGPIGRGSDHDDAR